MGFRLPRVVSAKQLLRRSYSNGNQAASALAADVPKGYLAVYVVGAESNMKRFVIPVSFLNQPSFQELLSQAEEEFGFDHPMGGLTIPCTEDYFIDLISCLNMTREMRLYVQHIDFGAVIIHDTIFGCLSSSLEGAELKADLLKQFLSTYKFRPIIPSTVASLQNKRVMRMERENTSYHRYAIDLCFLPK